MKKFAAIILTAVLAFSLIGCANGGDDLQSADSLPSETADVSGDIQTSSEPQASSEDASSEESPSSEPETSSGRSQPANPSKPQNPTAPVVTSSKPAQTVTSKPPASATTSTPSAPEPPKEPSAFERYDTVMKQADALKQVHTDADLTGTVDWGDIAVRIPINIVTKHDSSNPSDPRMMSNLTLTPPAATGGDPVTMQILYAGGVLYQDDGEYKIKARTDYENVVTCDSTDCHFQESDFTKLTVEKSGGNYLIRYQCRPDASSATIETMLSLYGFLGTQYTVKEISGSVLADASNQLLQETTVIVFETNMEGQEVTVRIESKESVVSRNRPLDIQAPADAANYIEIPA